ncbi:MAG: alpha/beta hydrolase [Acidimicrobiia bacterium]|nr:MAG: alpha/beta hydrolase [Acidimicrobiia bacterium]
MIVTEQPEWFRKALSAPYDEGTVAVEGADIHYLEWGERGQPGLIFVHGGAAHAHWWSYLAPFFARRWHAVAFDLSGHGDSGRRPEYSHDLWADEVLGVAEQVGFPGPPVVVGHSLGGVVTIKTAATHGDRIAGAVVVDSPVRGQDPESREGASGKSPFRAPGVYPDKETAAGRFRLIPEQPCDNQYILDYIADHSLVETENGWTWKFDPQVFNQTLTSLHEELASVKGRIALLRGEHSVVVPEDVADYMYELMNRNAPVASIPDAHHHLIVDQPLAFVAALRTLLADWEHSVPRAKL